MKSIYRYLTLIILISSSIFIFGQTHAKNSVEMFPSKPVRLIIPFSPGGSNDVVGRVIAQKLTEYWRRQVVADNRPGANGLIGTDITSNAQPDGYTLVVVSTSFVTNPTLQKTVDPLGYLAPVAIVAQSPLVLSASPSFAANSIQSLIALAKSKPREIAFASAGTGNLTHLAGELLQKMAGITLLHVPYKGGAPALVDVFGQRIPTIISGIAPVLPHIKSGRLRALGVGGKSRSKFLPEIPAISEVVAGYEAPIWWGIMAPPATQKSTVEKVNKFINRALQENDVRQVFASIGMEEFILSPSLFSQQVVSDHKKWGLIMKELDVDIK